MKNRDFAGNCSHAHTHRSPLTPTSHAHRSRQNQRTLFFRDRPLDTAAKRLRTYLTAFPKRSEDLFDDIVIEITDSRFPCSAGGKISVEQVNRAFDQDIVTVEREKKSKTISSDIMFPPSGNIIFPASAKYHVPGGTEKEGWGFVTVPNVSRTACRVLRRGGRIFCVRLRGRHG